MKTDAPKRKIFNDAVDLLSPGENAPCGSGVEMLDIDAIKPFRHHPFHLYEGERLNDMVESIKEHGILNPVIVRKCTTDMKCFQAITDRMPQNWQV